MSLEIDFEWKYGNYSFVDSFTNIDERIDYHPFIYNYFLEAHIIKLIEEYFEIESKSEYNRVDLLKRIIYDNNVEIYIDNVRYIVSSINRLWLFDRAINYYKENTKKEVYEDLRILNENVNNVSNRFYIKRIDDLASICDKYSFDSKKLKFEYDAQNGMYINENVLKSIITKIISNNNSQDSEKFDVLNDIKNAFLNVDNYHYGINTFEIAFLLFNEEKCQSFISRFINNTKKNISDYLNGVDYKANVYTGEFDRIVNNSNLHFQNKLWKEKYAKTKTGCFATLHIRTSYNGIEIVKSFYSLSGANDYVGKHDFKIDPKKKKDIDDLASRLNKCFFGGKYIYAPLSDLTKRYTLIQNDNEPIRFIFNNGFKQVDDDTRNIKNAELLGLNYGCCERKLIASIDQYKKIDNIDKIFCIKYVPCEKCQQAILDEKGNKEIYAIYNNSHEMRMIDRKHIIRPEKLYLKERYVLNRC